MEKTKKRLSALVMAVVLLAALACGGVAAWAVGTWWDPTTHQYSITVNITAATPEDAADLGSADVVWDVYKIANAKADDSYETFNYELLPEISAAATDPSKLVIPTGEAANAESWQKLANAVAELSVIERTANGVSNNATTTKEEALGDGLYLVLAHGKGETASNAAKGDLYQYNFLPTIVALPTKAPLAGQTEAYNGHEYPVAVTSQEGGEWITGATINMKYDKEPLYGSLVIKKNVNNPGEYEIEPASFVFHITGKLKGADTYDDYALVHYEGGKSASTTVGPIQAGTEVTVTEVPLGDYDTLPSSVQSETPSPAWLLSENHLTEVIKAGDVTNAVTVEFTNEYHPPMGMAVENKFELVNTGDNESSWDWKLVQVTPESAQTETTD